MNVHQALRSGAQKIQEPIGEVELFAGKEMLHPIVLNEAPGLPNHDAAKGDAGVDQKRSLHRLEEVAKPFPPSHCQRLGRLSDLSNHRWE